MVTGVHTFALPIYNATDGLLDDWTDQAEQRAWFLAATIGKA
jgi:hypothetical protein